MPYIKKAVTLCKAVMRNGYDAYAINAPLQNFLLEKATKKEIDIACSCDLETLLKILPNATPYNEDGAMAVLQEEDGTLYFYPTDVEDASHPERALLRITPRLIKVLRERALPYNVQIPRSGSPEEGFVNFKTCSCIKFDGIPSLTLSQNYLRAIRALRFAANYDLPIDPQSWMSIIQAANRILDYVPAQSIMEEWRMVSAETMWKFVRLLYDSQILHGLMPEIAALACVMQNRDENNANGTMENVFDHTIECMRFYPEGEFSQDWIGVVATLFHDIGKLYTAEYIDGHWTFYQHHRVGAGVTRKILRRLHFDSEDIDTICHLVRHHMHFHFMLTDRGLRRFKTLPENARLMAICRADIQARNGSYTSFNHNQKYLERTETAEIMLEPLLNGNEIMEHINLPPGPIVGEIRDALLKAQKSGDVVNRDDAIAFVKNYSQKN